MNRQSGLFGDQPTPKCRACGRLQGATLAAGVDGRGALVNRVRVSVCLDGVCQICHHIIRAGVAREVAA